MIFKGYLFSILYGVVCLALALVAYRAGMPKKYSRKLVHILVGFEWLILQYYLGASWHFVAVCLGFTALLALSHFAKLMPMISSDGDNSPGTVYYGVSMSIMSVITVLIPAFMYPFGIAVFATSFGDGFAGVFGSMIKKGNPSVYRNKTLFGSLFCFVFSFLAALILDIAFTVGLGVPYCLAVALLSAGLELISSRGLDNIAIPLGVSVFSYFLINFSATSSYIIPIILTPIVIAVAEEKRLLTKSGIVCAIILDIIVSVALGNLGFVLLLSFLLGSAVIDKIKKKAKEKDDISEKSSHRDELQVLANGLAAAVFAIMLFVSKNAAFAVAFVAALAECFSDTAASGIGAFSKKTYDIFRMRRIENGLSGGVSLVGTVSGLIAAAVFPLICLPFGIMQPKLYIIAALSAFLGCIFDSFLGSLFQAKYRCPVCGKITEKPVHCDNRGELSSGFVIVTNDLVNLLSSIFAGVVAFLLYTLI